MSIQGLFRRETVDAFLGVGSHDEHPCHDNENSSVGFRVQASSVKDLGVECLTIRIVIRDENDDGGEQLMTTATKMVFVHRHSPHQASEAKCSRALCLKP